MKFHQTILLSIIDCWKERSAQRDFIMFIFTEPSLWVIHHKRQISAGAFTGGAVLDSRTQYFSINIREIYARKLSTQDAFSFYSFLQHCWNQICRNKQSKAQNYCPGWLRVSFIGHMDVETIVLDPPKILFQLMYWLTCITMYFEIHGCRMSKQNWNFSKFARGRRWSLS